MDDLIERLQAGCVYRPKRWSGDTHDDLGGPIDEAATESLLAEAAEALSQQRAVPEGYALVPVEPTAAMVNAAANYDTGSSDGTVGRFCAGEIWYLMLAAARSPEQEK